jgi:hypothetical protein
MRCKLRGTAAEVFATEMISDANGTPGKTITSGSLRVQIEYTMAAPVSAD